VCCSALHCAAVCYCLLHCSAVCYSGSVDCQPTFAEKPHTNQALFQKMLQGFVVKNPCNLTSLQVVATPTHTRRAQLLRPKKIGCAP